MTKKDLIEKRGRRCEDCGGTQWKNQSIPLEIHHVNPPSESEKDLRLLCPNCHALTPNYRGKGIKTARSVTDEKLREAATNSNSLRQVLISLNLVAKGANYEALRKRLIKLDLYHKFKPKILTRYCLGCGEIVLANSRFCSRSCSNKFNGGQSLQKRKIAWPAIEIVTMMVENSGYSETGRQLGVSDNAVRKFLKFNKAGH